jgi:hypothetical protein
LVLYSAFGLSLASDCPIPGLIPQASPSPPDIVVRFAAPSAPATQDDVEEPYYVSDLEDGVVALQVWRATGGGHFRLRYADDTQFLVAAGGNRVEVVAPPGTTLEDSATYLLGPVLGLAMRLRGVTCLHASAISMGDEAIVIAGPAGAGKSTAAACFAEMGRAILTDDVAALSIRDGVVHVQPAYPQLRLWPDSVSMLFGSPDALPRLTPTWEKCALTLSQPGAFETRSLPLKAIYVLDGDDEYGEVTVAQVNGAERLRTLVANTYVGYLLDGTMRQQEFDTLTRVACTVPVRKVGRDVHSRCVSSLCARLVEDCEGLHV